MESTRGSRRVRRSSKRDLQNSSPGKYTCNCFTRNQTWPKADIKTVTHQRDPLKQPDISLPLFAKLPTRHNMIPNSQQHHQPHQDPSKMCTYLPAVRLKSRTTIGWRQTPVLFELLNFERTRWIRALFEQSLSKLEAKPC